MEIRIYLGRNSAGRPNLSVRTAFELFSVVKSPGRLVLHLCRAAADRAAVWAVLGARFEVFTRTCRSFARDFVRLETAVIARVQLWTIHENSIVMNILQKTLLILYEIIRRVQNR